MTIRNIKEEDHKLLETFIASCGSSLNTFRYFNNRPFSIIKNHLSTLLAIDEADIPVAYGHLDREDGIVWLGICVSEKNQGKGYGDIIMKALIEDALRLKISEIYLTVDKVNSLAARLYEKHGFEMIRESEKIFWYRWNSPVG
jgi:GNAT superfamily N-acetyltransferase